MAKKVKAKQESVLSTDDLKEMEDKANKAMAEVADNPIVTPDKPTYKCIGGLAFMYRQFTRNPRSLAKILGKDAIAAIEYINKYDISVTKANKAMSLLEQKKREKIDNVMKLIGGLILGDEKIVQEECEKAEAERKRKQAIKQKRLAKIAKEEKEAKEKLEKEKEKKENEQPEGNSK